MKKEIKFFDKPIPDFERKTRKKHLKREKKKEVMFEFYWE
jgi:hypothetical protein